MGQRTFIGEEAHHIGLDRGHGSGTYANGRGDGPDGRNDGYGDGCGYGIIGNGNGKGHDFHGDFDGDGYGGYSHSRDRNSCDIFCYLGFNGYGNDVSGGY